MWNENSKGKHWETQLSHASFLLVTAKTGGTASKIHDKNTNGMKNPGPLFRDSPKLKHHS